MDGKGKESLAYQMQRNTNELNRNEKNREEKKRKERKEKNRKKREEKESLKRLRFQLSSRSVVILETCIFGYLDSFL